VRTLTLVNGRRHVAGFRGTSAVDVSSIPRALVESAEVTTGGASAIYGADAVTGVVNFVLKDDFEGFEADLRGGISTHGDAENFTIDATYGKNFDNDRGNAVLSVSFVEDTALTMADRSFSRDNNIAASLANPALRLQASDLGADTPNFNGLTIGTLLGDIGTEGLTLTAAEQALLSRATGAAPRVIARDPRVWLSSQTGSIAPTFTQVSAALAILMAAVVVDFLTSTKTHSIPKQTRYRLTLIQNTIWLLVLRPSWKLNM